MDTIKELELKNIKRFCGFSGIYENSRPVMPLFPVEVITKYLGKRPERVVDLGCGTGLSTVVWENCRSEIIGIEPNDEMLSVARQKESDKIKFIKAYSHSTDISENSADAVICSQSFHWMNPAQTLKEVNRILKENGVFATVDSDWPPVCNWEAELAYKELFDKVRETENQYPETNSFIQYDKNKHLTNIKNSGYFRYAREIVFGNREKCTAERFINLALSQGGLQNVLGKKPEFIRDDINLFKEKINNIFGDKEFDIDFCYRMRIAVK